MLPPEQYAARYERFLSRLREARRRAGLTQAEVVARLGKPQSFVSKCESGERRVDFVELLQFSELYGVQVSFFVQLDVDDPFTFLDRLEGSRRGLAFPFQPPLPRRPRSWFATELPTDPLTDPQVRPGDIETKVPIRELQARLLRLRNRDREFREEQGISVLYLACGFLHWIDETDVQAIAPLALIPCSLERDSPRDPFILKRNEAALRASLRC